MKDQAGEGIKAVKASVRRHFKHIEQSESHAKAHTHDILRRLESAPEYAKAMAFDILERAAGDLDATQLDHLTRLIVLPDIQKDIEAGLYEDKELPFGYESAEQVADDLARFQSEATPEIMDALARRNELVGEVTRDLVDAGLLPSDALEDSRYYHRQVLDHYRMREIQFPGTGSEDVRLHRKGFQYARTGGSDFNTQWEQAEFEWLSQAHTLLERKAALDAIESIWNIKDGLKRQAKAENMAALAEMTDEDVLLPFRQKIAIANQNLAKLAAGEVEGESIPPGPFDHVWESLAESKRFYDANRADLPRGEKGNMPPFRFEHPDWFPALSWLLETGGSGSMQAATVFKAIADRNRFVKETLGDRFKTWRDLVPEKHPKALEKVVLWQPEEGNQFFLSHTVSERVLDRAIEEGRPLSKDETNMMLVVGGPKDEWVLPESVALTLDNFRRHVDDSAIVDASAFITSTWKQWILLNPVRALKYNVNNQSGDMDIAMAYRPEIVAQRMVPAARDLHRWMYGDEKAKAPLREEVMDAQRLGVLDSGLTLQEIPDISDIGVFGELSDPDQTAAFWKRAVSKYWGSVRKATVWRENTLRLAAYRYFLENQGEYGVSNPEHVDAIKDPKERAAKMARELIGDYGNLSQAGLALRRHLLPFWSWAEINAPRYVWLMKNAQVNAAARGESDGKVVGRVAGVAAKRGITSAAKFALQANIMFALVNLWNWLRFPEEAAELQRGRRQLHIILGRRSDGSIRSIRFQGALSDALEWINLGDWPADLRDIMEKKRDLVDIGAEAVKAPVEKVVRLTTPYLSTPYEVMTKRSTFPRVFEEGKSFKTRLSPIRDPMERALNMWSLDKLYGLVTGKPRRSTDPVNAALDALLTYSTDPGEASYWGVRSEAVDWLKQQGREFPDVTPTERSNALYYFRRAAAWGDEKAMGKWLRRYYELGGTSRGLRSSIRRAHPLGSIPRAQRRAFVNSLGERDRELLDRAVEWYESVYLEEDAPARQAVQREWENIRALAGER